MNTLLRQSITFTLTFAAMLALSLPAKAGLITSGTVGELSDNGVLVGTSFDPHNDTLERVNEIIAGAGNTEPDFIGWNEKFDPDLPLAYGFLQKFEELGGGPIGSTQGALSISDFIWYTNTDLTALGVNTTDKWMGVNLWLIDDQDILKYNGLAFEAKGGVDDTHIQYVTAKSDATASGFSVWTYDPNGINALYVDPDGDLDTKFDGTTHAVSHVSFYGTPEPTSLILAGMGCLGLIGYGVRNRRKDQNGDPASSK